MNNEPSLFNGWVIKKGANVDYRIKIRKFRLLNLKEKGCVHFNAERVKDMNWAENLRTIKHSKYKLNFNIKERKEKKMFRSKTLKKETKKKEKERKLFWRISSEFKWREREEKCCLVMWSDFSETGTQKNFWIIKNEGKGLKRKLSLAIDIRRYN